MTGTRNRSVAIALTGSVVLTGLLALGTCVGPETGRPLDLEPTASGTPAVDGRGGATLAAPGAAGRGRDAAGADGDAAGPTGKAGPTGEPAVESRAAGRSGAGGALVLRDAVTGELVPHYHVRFRDRDREVVLGATDERGRLDAFRSWLGRGAVSLLDEPELPRERWREAPDPVWCGDHYELSIEVGPTWPLVLTGHGPGEEDALEAWLQVPEGLAATRERARTTSVRWEGGSPWVRLPAFREGMRSFVARQSKALIVRSPREERIGRASVNGVLGRQERALVIELAPSYVLRGRVRDLGGRPLRDASLVIWAEGERPPWGPDVGTAFAGEDGRFELFGLGERRYSATFYATGYQDLHRVVDVTEPGGFEVVLLPETPGEHTLVVEVRGSVASGLVASLFPQATSDEPRDVDLERKGARHVGAFRGLHPGHYRLFVEPLRGEAILEAGFDGAIDVTLPREDPVVLNAEARNMVELHVTLDGGEPDRGVMFYGSEDGRTFRRVASIARFGRVDLSAASLTHPMWALMDGYQPIELRDLDAAADSGRLDLEPVPGWGVFVRVVDGSGTPVEGILATLHGDGLGLSDELGAIAVGLAPEESTLPVELVRGEDAVGSVELVRRPASAAIVEVKVED